MSFLCACVIVAPAAADERSDFFERRIRPLLVAHCYDCHGPQEASGQLRLDTRAGWVRGGKSGPAIVPGDPSSSLLLRAVAHLDDDLKMPPPDAGEKLSEQQIQDLALWIRQGAIDPRGEEDIASREAEAAEKHWAFQPIAMPPLANTAQHPVDYLIDKQLQARGFVSAGLADTRTLIRRATYDLHGLPPTAAQLATPPEQYPQLVRQLLASPRYGERWARHWLDVARYSDAKDGVLMYGDARIRPFAYTYRDYVIRAFNADKPFDEFIREQIAADQMGRARNSPELAALGLLTLGRMFDRNRHDVIDDQIDVITRGFLGLTVSCARCHDHKFDPIPTADYYSLYGVFASSIEPLDRPRIEAVSAAGLAYEKELKEKLDEVHAVQETHYEETLRTARQRTPDYLVQVATTEPDISETTYFFLSLIPEQLRPQITFRWRQLIARRAFPDDPVFAPWFDLLQMYNGGPTASPAAGPPEGLYATLAERWKAAGVDSRIMDGLMAARPGTAAEMARTYGEVIRAAWASSEDRSLDSDPLVSLLVGTDSPVWFPVHEIGHYLSRKPKDEFRGLVGQLDAISVKHPAAAARAMVMADSEAICDPVIFQRGDPSQRGAPVPRQFLQLLSSARREAFSHGSGRRDLAHSIASAANPLTARVWANRVWMHHFGQPLVDTPSDFGLRTEQPVQHELLDFLAATLNQRDWSTKALHDVIMTSAAYQRSSSIQHDARLAGQWQADPGNRLLWRANRRRLDLEQMRDTMLALAGQLDHTMYGRPGLITDAGNRRRTIYAFVERQNIPDIFQTFDFANADTSTARRVMTTVPQQALFMMNSDFMLQIAGSLAGRATVGSNTERIHRMYEIALGRAPSEHEVRLAHQFIETNPWEQYAQVLLMSNELMYLD